MVEAIIRLKINFASWFHKIQPGKYCWADCVSWAYSNRLNPFKIETAKTCEAESKTHPTGTCYCGGWKAGKCFDTLPKEEKEKIWAHHKIESTNYEEPF